MSSSARQDMPPAGGWGARINTLRTPVKTPLSNVALLAVAAGTIVYGLGRYISAAREENKIRMARADERERFLPVAQRAVNARADFERSLVKAVILSDAKKLASDAKQ